MFVPSVVQRLAVVKMKAYFFYRPNTDAYLSIDTFFKLLGDKQKSKLEIHNVDTREGDQLSQLYQIMAYPSIVIARDDGAQIRVWHGQLPLVEDLTIYLNSL